MHLPDQARQAQPPHAAPRAPAQPGPPHVSILKRYARVIAVVGGATRFRRDAKWQGLTLADVARDIPKYREFCRLCSADMQDTWFNDRDNNVRTTDNRCETWERLYLHWHGHHGTAEHPPAIRVRSVSRTGSYVVEPDIEGRSAERVWSKAAKALREAKLPEHVIDQIQRDNEHYYEEFEAASAQAAAPPNEGGAALPANVLSAKALASPSPSV